MVARMVIVVISFGSTPASLSIDIRTVRVVRIASLRSARAAPSTRGWTVWRNSRMPQVLDRCSRAAMAA